MIPDRYDRPVTDVIAGATVIGVLLLAAAFMFTLAACLSSLNGGG